MTYRKTRPRLGYYGLQLVASTSTGAPRLLSFTKTNSPASHSSYQPYPPSLPSLPLASIALLGPTRNNPCCRFRYIAASVDGSRSKKRIMLESSQSQMQMHHFMRPPAPATARCKRLRAYPGSFLLLSCVRHLILTLNLTLLTLSLH